MQAKLNSTDNSILERYAIDLIQNLTWFNELDERGQSQIECFIVK